MARKSSDMVLLLGSRGQYRGRNSSFFKSLRSTVSSFFGRAGSGRRSSRSSNSSSGGNALGGLAILAVLLVGFVGGYVVRGQVAAGSPKDGNAGLKAGPQAPEIVGEDTGALTSQAFIVSVYPGVEDANARRQARQLSEYLRQQGLPRVRPYHYLGTEGLVWVVAVYFDGEAEQAAVREKLRLLPESVPDANFAELRKTVADWPTAYPIQ